MRPPDARLAFILGSGRSGSTLLTECLCYHPDVGFISNIDNWFPVVSRQGRQNNQLYRRLPAWLTGRTGRKRDISPPAERLARLAERLSVRFAPSEAYRIIGREVSPMMVDPHRDLTREDYTPWVGERLRRLFMGRAEAQGKPLFVHKLTGWPRAGLLAETFPQARFVHVLRDGRGVANSLLHQPWWRGYEGPARWGFGPLPPHYEEEWKASGGSFVVLSGIQWKMLMDAFDAAKATVPAAQWMDLKYEDFLAAPEEILREILAFLGLEWGSEVQVALAGLELRPERQAAYLHELTPHQVDQLNASLEGHLQKLGYADLQESPALRP